MAQSPDERRGYQRGYNRAHSKIASHVQRVIKIARGYRDRLTDTDSARICETCARWKRGGANCMWGACDADFEWGIEPRMWADTNAGESPHRKIITQPNFGCVSWLPRPKDEPTEGSAS
jgi:hypothetical protein